ncbi:hypothetical protein GCM10023221_32920 [Luteimicrobium xylanilyticum]|uniref:DNA helicase n=1 Tax=Luteimicrobium xylanilyticum TaxID=1133546 RepID=A0A5P9QAK0_9MICO|nr:hypothetical protein [Luteimicrobium xylanilyticum]QFU98092.1 DNA helicase [Luteimicrobium xylanilyticum]
MSSDEPSPDAPDGAVPADLADRLYGLPLDEFVAARDAAAREARAAGDRALGRRLGGLPKPTVGAWAVNRAVRTVPHAVAAVLAIGDALRDATAQRDRERLVALDRERRRVLDALLDGVADGVRPGGRPLTDAALRTVRDTFVAAVADPGAAGAVRAGRLSRGLEHVGFGLVDESGEPVELEAGPPVPDARTRVPRVPAPDGSGHDAVEEADASEEAVAEAEESLDRAEEALDAARATHDERQATLDTATDALEQADAAVAALEAELARLRPARAARAADADRARAASEDSARDVARREEDVAAAQEAAAAARRLRRAARRRPDGPSGPDRA